MCRVLDHQQRPQGFASSRAVAPDCPSLGTQNHMWTRSQTRNTEKSRSLTLVVQTCWCHCTGFEETAGRKETPDPEKKLRWDKGVPENRSQVLCLAPSHQKRNDLTFCAQTQKGGKELEDVCLCCWKSVWLAWTPSFLCLLLLDHRCPLPWVGPWGVLKTATSTILSSAKRERDRETEREKREGERERETEIEIPHLPQSSE